jgi:hypothetical protein
LERELEEQQKLSEKLVVEWWIKTQFHNRKRTQKSGPQGPKREFTDGPFVWEEHLQRLNEREFKLYYRLDPASFEKLHAMLLPCIETKDKQKAKNSRDCGEVPSRVRLGLTLRYFSGAQMLDLRLLYKISNGECQKSLWRVVDAINTVFKVTFPLNDVEKLREIERGFAAAHYRRYGVDCWRGQVGATDGVDFEQFNPGTAVDNPRRYFVERKNAYCLLCIAVCDNDRRFLFWDISKEACSHDSLAWLDTTLAQDIKKGLLPTGFFLNGDSAFTCDEHMITLPR